MEPNSIARTSCLERLPLELIRAILCQLNGLTTLRCAILSCHSVLNSFTGSSSVIATRVLLNELDSCDVRPEAMAALLASRLARPTRSSVHEFYKAHLQKRNVEVGIRLTLKEVADLSRLHSAVLRLVKDFTEARLQELVAAMKDGHTSQPQFQSLELSILERHRIMRTLYILEIFFNVFRQTSMPKIELGQCMNDFLFAFAHWEIEQIACVQDFLFFQVSPSFNEMAAHDVCWGAFEVEPARWLGDSYLQSLYFKGLVFLESFAKAKTYDRQLELLYHGRLLDHGQLLDHWQLPHIRPHNFHRALRDFSYEMRNEEASVSKYENSRDYALKVKPLYFEDPDDGPFSIWKWAHESESLGRSVYQRRQAKLRKWGYVMWDQARLDTLPISRDRWQLPTFSLFDRSLHDAPVGEVDDSWTFSWRERKQIYKKKGRGWWDFGDESKIEWTPRVQPKDNPEKIHIIPTSLDEAKRVIFALERP
ncbi:hypothetical protein F5Y19DRAFT_434524 [Xylariaceae sp. FL1651]|nr:hypothetical protein F5Y19DRAFT_434524 [Xylariaceae sp. FL1651]